MDHVVRTLLARLGTLGIRSKRLLLDRGFDRGRVMRELRTAELPFRRPAVQRGTKPPTPGGPTGTDALAAEKQGRWPR
jgi:hypothetical protein